MSIDNMKNMVILKDLPSNIVEEAIVILKPNIKFKSLDFSRNNNITNGKTTEENPKKHIINEAGMIIANYISEIEVNRNKNMKINKSIENKCKRLKLLSVFLGIMLLASFIVK